MHLLGYRGGTPRNASPVFVASMQASVTLLRVFGVHVEILKSLPTAVTSLGVRAAK